MALVKTTFLLVVYFPVWARSLEHGNPPEREGHSRLSLSNVHKEGGDAPLWELSSSQGAYGFEDLRRGAAGVFPEPERASLSRDAWQRVARKLKEGRGVTIYGIGSSILGAHGGCSEALPVLQELCGTCCMLQGTQPVSDMSGERMNNSCTNHCCMLIPPQAP